MVRLNGNLSLSLSLLVAGLFVACAESVNDPAPLDDPNASFGPSLGKGDAWADAPSEDMRCRLLELVNQASFEHLDDVVPLDRRAAENIIAHRLGDDGIEGTRDDDPIDDLGELDGIPWVGPSAYARLLEHVADRASIACPSDPTAPPATTPQTVADFRALYDAMEPVFRTADGLPETPGSFRTARRWALTVYEERPISFYCGCDFDADAVLDPRSCGYQPRNDNVRAMRMEWEHLVPVNDFGEAFSCWTAPTCPDGSDDVGRQCCTKVDPDFRRIENDLVNLVPSVGELNADRSNRSYGAVDGESRDYGACDFEVDWERDVVEPADELLGDIARAYLYIEKVYGVLGLSDAELALYAGWHLADPPTDWELERNRQIIARQGSGNPFVE